MRKTYKIDKMKNLKKKLKERQKDLKNILNDINNSLCDADLRTKIGKEQEELLQNQFQDLSKAYGNLIDSMIKLDLVTTTPDPKLGCVDCVFDGTLNCFFEKCGGSDECTKPIKYVVSK